MTFAEARSDSINHESMGTINLYVLLLLFDIAN